MNLRETLHDADKKGIGIGHFNFSNLEGFWGIFNASRELNLPIILGTSEGERDFVGVRQAVALVRSLREEFNYPVFLNADHTYSPDRVEEAAKAGYDAVIFDGAKLPLEENIRLTKESVVRAKAINPDILVEAEMGYIGTSSKLLEEIPEGASVTNESYTRAEEAKEFVERTGIDLFAPSVGNLHGMLKHAKNPELDIARIKNIKEATNVPLVLHGGSGISNHDFQNAIRAGINIIHINTEIRIAFRKNLEEVLKKKPDEIAPYKYLKEPRAAIEEVVKERLTLFSSL